MDDATITFLVLGAAVALFVWNRLPVGIVAIGASLALYAAGVIDVREAFAGFGDPTVIFIASLFILSEALDATGITTWAGQRLVELAGSSRTRLAVLLLVLSALLSSILTPNGAVAALVPLTVIIALRLGRAPSELLLPMAFSAHAGALLLLTGSPVNVLVAEEAERAGSGRFGYFEFALVGVPLIVGTVLLAILLGPRLLPRRRPQAISSDFSDHARTLLSEYAPDQRLLAEHEVPRELFTRRGGVAEVVVAPRSPLIGQGAFPGMITPSGDLLVLAVRRQGRDVGPGEVTLAPGDTLLLEGTWEALDEHLTDDEVLVVDAPSDVRRQTVALGPGARRALLVLAAMIAALASGAVPAAVAGVVAAMALVLLRVIDVEQAHRAVAWTAVFLIAGLIPVTTALQTTGAAGNLASLVLDVIGDAGGYALLATLFVVAAALSATISNTATALILIPVGLSAASSLEISPEPVLMSLAVACSASFLTPISTPGNLMVMGPGGYRFGDYWRFGVPLLGLFFVVSVLLVPLIWSF